MSAVRTNDLTVTYGNVLALERVSIDVPRGSSVAIIGPNGCGKSTLLKTLAGIVSPTSGTAHVDGRPAMVLQSTDVDQSVPITVRDAVAMGRYSTLGPIRRFRPADWATIHEAMTRLAIDDLANRPIHHLSGGQRQRVLVAQGLTQESSVLLLDEPLTALDVASRSIILDVLDEEKLGGRTMITSTHNFQDAQRSDLVLLLATHLVAFGPASEVLTEDQLHKAFGGQFVRVGSTLLLSDSHHEESH
ncbi:MAG: metal ABC transporter ATP-binding protein [Actinomycetota bacterium]